VTKTVFLIDFEIGTGLYHDTLTAHQLYHEKANRLSQICGHTIEIITRSLCSATLEEINHHKPIAVIFGGCLTPVSDYQPEDVAMLLSVMENPDIPTFLICGSMQAYFYHRHNWTLSHLGPLRPGETDPAPWMCPGYKKEHGYIQITPIKQTSFHGSPWDDTLEQTVTVYSTHAQEVIGEAPDWTLLGSTQKCKNQILLKNWKGAPKMASQFHPEMDPENMDHNFGPQLLRWFLAQAERHHRRQRERSLYILTSGKCLPPAELAHARAVSEHLSIVAHQLGLRPLPIEINHSSDYDRLDSDIAALNHLEGLPSTPTCPPLATYTLEERRQKMLPCLPSEAKKLSQDKLKTKELFADIKNPYFAIPPAYASKETLPDAGYPLILKIVDHHNSQLIDPACIAHSQKDADRIWDTLIPHGRVYAEPFIHGTEITISILDEHIYDVMEITVASPETKPATDCGRAIKWDHNTQLKESRKLLPISNTPEGAMARDLVQLLKKKFGVVGPSRFDFRKDARGILHLIDANFTPSLHPKSVFLKSHDTKTVLARLLSAAKQTSQS
jgi:GMP synthase-like glutamine amidotransferase